VQFDEAVAKCVARLHQVAKREPWFRS
jgi:hypothetical protein